MTKSERRSPSVPPSAAPQASPSRLEISRCWTRLFPRHQFTYTSAAESMQSTPTLGPPPLRRSASARATGHHPAAMARSQSSAQHRSETPLHRSALPNRQRPARSAHLPLPGRADLGGLSPCTHCCVIWPVAHDDPHGPSSLVAMHPDASAGIAIRGRSDLPATRAARITSRRSSITGRLVDQRSHPRRHRVLPMHWLAGVGLEPTRSCMMPAHLGPAGAEAAAFAQLRGGDSADRGAGPNNHPQHSFSDQRFLHAQQSD